MPGLKAVAFTKQVSEGKGMQRVGKEQAAGPGPLPISSDIYRIIRRSNLRAHNNSWGLDLCPLSPTSMIERSTNLRKTIDDDDNDEQTATEAEDNNITEAFNNDDNNNNQ